MISKQNQVLKEKAMRKLLIAGVLGAIVMVTGMGTQAASAAMYRGGFRGHVVGHPAVRTVYRPGFGAGHFYGRGYVDRFGRCW
jgi:hypothetical protein